nr:uncharacterized protein LOC128699810 isoform X1 [Cherax quadricarinatus]
MKTFLPLGLTLLAVAANAAPAAQTGSLSGTSMWGNNVGNKPAPPSHSIHNDDVKPTASPSDDSSEETSSEETPSEGSSSEESSEEDKTEVPATITSTHIKKPFTSPNNVNKLVASSSFSKTGSNSRPVRHVPSTTTEKNTSSTTVKTTTN